jgi:hypothetical protein
VFTLRSTHGNGKVVNFWSLVRQGPCCSWLLLQTLEEESKPFLLKMAEVIGQSRKPVTTLKGKHCQQVTYLRHETCKSMNCTKELNHICMRKLPGGPAKDSWRPEKYI